MIAFQQRWEGMSFMSTLPWALPVCVTVVFLIERWNTWCCGVSLGPPCSQVTTNPAFRACSPWPLREPAPAGLFFTPAPRAAVSSWSPQGKRNVKQSKCSTLGESLNKLCYIYPMQYYIIVKSHVSSKTNDLDKQSYYMLKMYGSHCRKNSGSFL